MNTNPEVVSASPTQALLRGVHAALKRPVLLDPRSVDAVLSTAVFHLQSGDSVPAGAEPFERRGNVAVVDIRGPLAQREWSCMGMFGGDGYDGIVQRMQAALADTQITGVLMRIDSPGGEVAGCFEAVRAIRTAAQASGKRVVAYADEIAASAAYALACAADYIMLPDTGSVGSVGVITTVVDQTAAYEQAGAKVHVITSGSRKADGHPAMPLSDDARGVIQAEIDHIAEVFAREVATARSAMGLSPSDVLGLEAALFLGQKAVAAGLANQVGNFNDALAIAASVQKPPPPNQVAASSSHHGDKTMKSLMVYLGLTENASEGEAIKAVKALAERSERAEKAVARFLASTGQADADAAAGVVDAWKIDATRAKALDAENKEMKAKQVEAEVDAALSEAKRTMRVLPAELPSLRAKGLEDPGWLKGYLAVKTSVAQGPAFTEPGREGDKTKAWKDMGPQQKAELYQSDRATYEALKAAAKAA